MVMNKEFIEHLSAEITTHAAHTMTFRSRLGFTVLIGPFIVMGSFLVATDGEVNHDAIDWRTALALFGAGVAYIALGYCGGRIDKHTLDQCNRWRKLLVDVASGNDVEDIRFESPVVPVYLKCFTLILFAFFCFGYAVWAVLPDK